MQYGRCLSQEPHECCDVILHYFGCLKLNERDRFLAGLPHEQAKELRVADAAIRELRLVMATDPFASETIVELEKGLAAFRLQIPRKRASPPRAREVINAAEAGVERRRSGGQQERGEVLDTIAAVPSPHPIGNAACDAEETATGHQSNRKNPYRHGHPACLVQSSATEPQPDGQHMWRCTKTSVEDLFDSDGSIEADDWKMGQGEGRLSWLHLPSSDNTVVRVHSCIGCNLSTCVIRISDLFSQAHRGNMTHQPGG